MACASRNSGLTALGLAGIHKLAAHNAIRESSFASLFESIHLARACERARQWRGWRDAHTRAADKAAARRHGRVATYFKCTRD